MHEPIVNLMRAAGSYHPPDGNFEGLLLAAHPGLKDPNFRHSVLYLSAHGAEIGAFGFVLNRPLGKSAAELLPEHDHRTLLERIPVYLGGPVGQDQLSFASLSLDATAADARFRPNLSLDEVADRLGDNPSGVRAFVGYAGWSAGQLEGELEQNSWLLVKPGPFARLPGSSQRFWHKVMGSLGPVYKLLAEIPDNPSLN